MIMLGLAHFANITMIVVIYHLHKYTGQRASPQLQVA